MATNRERGSKGRRRGSGAKTERVVRVDVAPTAPTAADERAVDEIVDAIDAWVGDFDAGKTRVGEMILRVVFANDAKAMVRADRGSNPRLRLLLARAERGRLSQGAMSVLLRTVAYDHLVRGRYWKRLATPVKEALLPLADKDNPHEPPTLRQLNEAAEHAIDFDLDAAAATRWVRTQLARKGRKSGRKATSRTFHKDLDRSLDLFGTDDGVARLVTVADALDEGDRNALTKKLAATAEALLAAVKTLRRG